VAWPVPAREIPIIFITFIAGFSLAPDTDTGSELGLRAHIPTDWKSADSVVIEFLDTTATRDLSEIGQ
jgi:hypothetical protein